MLPNNAYDTGMVANARIEISFICNSTRKKWIYIIFFCIKLSIRRSEAQTHEHSSIFLDGSKEISRSVTLVRYCSIWKVKKKKKKFNILFKLSDSVIFGVLRGTLNNWTSTQINPISNNVNSTFTERYWNGGEIERMAMLMLKLRV